jgi:hypothetical protein
VAAACAAGAGVSAHRLDECLQAARIAIEPDHVGLELDLTPGRAVADAIIADIAAPVRTFRRTTPGSIGCSSATRTGVTSASIWPTRWCPRVLGSA